MTPELRNASSRSRCSSVLRSNSMVAKVCSDGRKVTSVPVRNSPLSRLGAAPVIASGVTGSPWREAHLVLDAAAVDGQLQPLGERVDHRDADAVQAAGDLVGVLVELTAGVQLGHDDLGRRDAFALVDVGGDAAAVVGDRGRAVGVEDHLDARRPAGQRLVDGVVHHLVDHVVQARAVIGVADVHARALAHRVEALEDLDGIRAVVGGAVSSYSSVIR